MRLVRLFQELSTSTKRRLARLSLLHLDERFNRPSTNLKKTYVYDMKHHLHRYHLHHLHHPFYHFDASEPPITHNNFENRRRQ